MTRIGSYLVAALATVSLVWPGEAAKTTLKVERMTCGGCVGVVRIQLKRTDGVAGYDVSYEKGERPR